MKKIKQSLVLSLALLLMSCSIQKRHYMSGYTINWKKSNSDVRVKEKSEINLTTTENNDKEETPLSDEFPVTASTIEFIPALSKTKELSGIKKVVKDSCDIIEMKSGKNIQAKVLEINPSEVKYKNCGDATGPDRIISKADIEGITYSNGTKENPENLKYSKPSEQEKQIVYIEAPPKAPQQEDLTTSTFAFVFGCCSFIPLVGWAFGIMSIILGIIALIKLKHNPGKYKHKAKVMAILGICIGVAGLIAGAAIVYSIFGSGGIGL